MNREKKRRQEKKNSSKTPPLVVHRLLFLFMCLLAGPIIDAGTAAQDSDTDERTLPPILNLHQWGAVTLFHGLPSDHVRAIVQDRDGVLWFGTDAGLALYDGRRIQTVGLAGLPSEHVRTLAFDADGVLWIGTDRGAARRVREAFEPVPETAGFSIASIVPASDKTVRLTTAQGVLLTCSPAADGRVSVRKLNTSPSNTPGDRPPTALTGLVPVSNGLLVGTRGRGVLRVQGESVTEIAGRPRAFFVTALASDTEGRVWFGSETGPKDGGLYFNDNPLRPQKIGSATGTVTSLGFDSDRRLWVGTAGRGVFCFQGALEVGRFTFENSAGGLRSNRIYTVFADREGVVWFGTDRGVCRYDPHSPKVERLAAEPESNFVRSLLRAEDGSLWCGSNKGLFERSPDAFAWRPVGELEGKSVHALFEDSQKRLLVGTSGGLFAGVAENGATTRRFTRIDRAEGENSPTAPVVESIRAVAEFQGRIYLANFGSGLERLDGDHRTFVQSLPGIVGLHSDADQRLWIGTAESGVLVFDGTQIARDPRTSGLDSFAVWSFAGSSAETLWIATNRGVHGLRGNTLFSALKDCNVRRVVEGGSKHDSAAEFVWCATDGAGLHKLDVSRFPLSPESGTLASRLDTEHGLPSDNIFALLASTDAGRESLLIGTGRGLATYEPGFVPPGLKPARVLGKRAYGLDELRTGLVLEYPQNSLLVEMLAVGSRTFPEQFQYSFTVTERDGNKVLLAKTSRDPQLPLENLRPGAYDVRVRAYTNDLTASEPFSFSFTVQRSPFPWTTTALFILLLFASAALWWGWRQNQRLTASNTALGDANRQLAEAHVQIAAEAENERRRIARDLHDQTLADLRQLLLLSDQLPSGTVNKNQEIVTPAYFRSEVEAISTEIRRICEDLSPSVLSNIGLAAALEWALADAVGHLPPEARFEHDFVCSEEVADRLNFDADTEIQIYRIVREAVTNICRHASAKHVRLSVETVEGGAFLIQIEDDGCGFDIDEGVRKTGRGLANMRSRAGLIGAETTWERRSEGGMTFTLRVTGMK